MKLTIASFNIWDIPLWFTRREFDRIDRIGKLFLEAGTDIVCLQESFDVAHRLLIHEKLGKQTYKHAGETDATRRVLFFKPFDVSGGLVVFSKYPILRSRFVPFPRLVNVSFVEFFSRKGFLDVVLELPQGPLHVINTHLHQDGIAWDDVIRRRQLRFLIKSLNEQDKDLPTIITGDLNEDYMMKKTEFASLVEKEGFRDAAYTMPKGSHPTHRPENPYANTLPNYTKSPRRLDYILVKNLDALGLRIDEYHPIPLPEPLSDHDPVILKLSGTARSRAKEV